MATFSKKVMGKEVGDAKTYAKPHNMSGKATSIKNAGRSSRIPTGRLLDSQSAFTVDGDSLQPVNTELKMLSADYDFIPTF